MSRSVGEFTLVGHLGEGSFATVSYMYTRDDESPRMFLGATLYFVLYTIYI